jgi:hypothetical protein
MEVLRRKGCDGGDAAATPRTIFWCLMRVFRHFASGFFAVIEGFQFYVAAGLFGDEADFLFGGFEFLAAVAGEGVRNGRLPETGVR